KRVTAEVPASSRLAHRLLAVRVGPAELRSGRSNRARRRQMKPNETLLTLPPPTPAQAGMMKALVYHGPGRRSWEEKPRPAPRAATAAVVRITTATICGTDLHILKGDVPTVADGRILGHEGIGVVEEAGTAVRDFKRGDRVLVSCITSCGSCDFCRKGM